MSLVRHDGLTRKADFREKARELIKISSTQEERRKASESLLTAELAHSLLSYDPLTGILTWKVRRSPQTPAGSQAGFITKNQHYRYVTINHRAYASHRLAWLITHGRWPESLLDHINGDRADNRLENLRECSFAENNQNTKSPRGKHLKGVYKSKYGITWKAQISSQGVMHYLGSFNSEIEAHEAYMEAKRRLHPFSARPEARAALGGSNE